MNTGIIKKWKSPMYLDIKIYPFLLDMYYFYIYDSYCSNDMISEKKFEGNRCFLFRNGFTWSYVLMW